MNLKKWVFGSRLFFCGAALLMWLYLVLSGFSNVKFLPTLSGLSMIFMLLGAVITLKNVREWEFSKGRVLDYQERIIDDLDEMRIRFAWEGNQSLDESTRAIKTTLRRMRK